MVTDHESFVRTVMKIGKCTTVVNGRLAFSFLGVGDWGEGGGLFICPFRV